MQYCDVYIYKVIIYCVFFFFQAEDGIRDVAVTGVQTCALPIFDVVGYRRHGHNEGDEPAYTQPVMYERIKQTPTARQRYADRLVGEGVVTDAQAGGEAEQVYQRLAEIQQSLKAHLREEGAGEEPQRI